MQLKSLSQQEELLLYQYNILNNDYVENIYVGDDSKLHKIQGGADSVLPFKDIKGLFMYFYRSNIAGGVMLCTPTETSTPAENKWLLDNRIMYSDTSSKATISLTAGKYDIMIHGSSGISGSIRLFNYEVESYEELTWNIGNSSTTQGMAIVVIYN